LPSTVAAISLFRPPTRSVPFKSGSRAILEAERQVEITGATPFRVEVDRDALDPDIPPLHLTGTFTRFEGYETICKALVHTDRFDGGSSHTMLRLRAPTCCSLGLPLFLFSSVSTRARVAVAFVDVCAYNPKTGAV